MGDISYDKQMFLATVYEQSDRHEESIKYMEEIVRIKKDDLSIEERNLLATAYKNLVDIPRVAWNKLLPIELKERKNGNSKYGSIVSSMKSSLKKEINEIAKKIINLIDTFLMKKAETDEAKVFYLKLKGDYLNYTAEVLPKEKREETINAALAAYKEAYETGEKLRCTHPIKLGISLNYARFHKEMKEDYVSAIRIASEAYDITNHELINIEDGEYRDCIPLLQLLKENIELWKKTIPKVEDKIEEKEIPIAKEGFTNVIA